MTRLLTDIAGPFYDPAKPFRNWSALPFYQLDLPQAPFVDLAQLERGLERAAFYLDEIVAQGYTGIVVDNLAHLVTFDQAPAQIYPPADPCRLRALAYGAAFGRLFAAAAAKGMEVFVTTDMQWATPGVRRYVGRLTPSNPRVAATNRWALEELFARFPQVTGLIVRVGEVGGAHNLGNCYTGHLLYRTPAALRRLLGDLLPVCERHNRLLVARTWSIGIGPLGDLLWSAARYAEVFGSLRSAHLLVSIKHGPADFFRHLPPNPTLGLPGPAQIVELQNRREYELFGMVPSGIATLHHQVFETARRRGGLAGVWAWNAVGGWGGGSAALSETGWSFWTELSSALTAALAYDAQLDAEAFVRAWCLTRLAPASGAAFAHATAKLYLASEHLIERGWYGGPLEGGPVLGRLVLPPLLWVWWMRPTAAAPLWAYLAAAVPDVNACLAASRAAAAELSAHAALLAALAPAGNAEAAFVATSARYLRDCVAVAVALRELLLPAFAAAGAGKRAEWVLASKQAPQTLAALAAHRAVWGERADFPALELDEVEAYLHRLAQAPQALWLSARVSGALTRWSLRDGLTQPGAWKAGALSLLLVGTWRSSRTRPVLLGLVAAGLLAVVLRRPVLGVALPWLSRRYQLLPSAFFETGPPLAEWIS